MATAAENLASAKSARHKLVTGQLPRVFIDQNGEQVQFTATNVGQLDAYIRKLEGEVDPDAARLSAPRPIRFTF